MVRSYVKKSHPDYNIDGIVKAIKNVKISGESVRKAAKNQKLPEATLRVYLNRFDNLIVDMETATDDDLWNAVDACKTSRKRVC